MSAQSAPLTARNSVGDTGMTCNQGGGSLPGSGNSAPMFSVDKSVKCIGKDEIQFLVLSNDGACSLYIRFDFECNKLKKKLHPPQ
jgi:hypothetical protein